MTGYNGKPITAHALIRAAMRINRDFDELKKFVQARNTGDTESHPAPLCEISPETDEQRERRKIEEAELARIFA